MKKSPKIKDFRPQIFLIVLAITAIVMAWIFRTSEPSGQDIITIISIMANVAFALIKLDELAFRRDKNDSRTDE